MSLIQNPKVIGRDPFARHDIIRQKVTDLKGGCGWCGQTQHVRIKNQGRYTGEVVERLYQYGIEPDAVRVRQHWSKGKFCSYSCCKSYHS